IWGKIDSANVARMGMEVRNPFGVFPDGFEPSKDHQFDFDPTGYQFLIAQCQALIDMFAGTYLPDAYGEAGIVQQDPTATEVKIEASKEEETSQGILERHACQFALLVGCCQRRVACKENLQAALAFIRAQEDAVKKKKILVPEQEYELITSIDTPENKAYLAEPDLGQADREAVNMLINLIQKGLTIPEIIVISRQPALAYTDNIGAKEDAKFVQFYPVAKNNPNFDQNKLDQEMAVSMIGPDRASEIFIPNPQATTQLEAGRQQLGEIGTMMTTPIPVPVSPRDDHLTHIATGQQWLNKSIGQMKQRAEDKTNPSGVLQIGDQMLGTTARIMQHIDGHIQQLLQQGSTEQAILQQMKTARANKNDMKVVMDHYQKAQQLAQQMQQQMAQMRAQAQAGQNGQNSGPFPELSQPMPQHAIPNESLPTPETPQHAAALPSGTHFMSPEGTRRVRP